MIRKVLLSTVAIVAISGTAFAADLPSRRAPPVYIPPPIPVFSWTGFYIGGDIGYGFGKDTATQANGYSYRVGNPGGVIGGGHIGYNLSTQSFPLLGGLGFGGSGGVIGVEGDITGTNTRGAVIFPAVGAGTIGNRISTEQGVGGSIRGRIGFAADRALFFATGGAAFAQFESHYTAFDAVGGTYGADLTHQRIGWTVGGGVEYAITTNWSLRAEYRYSDFGSYLDSVPASAVLPADAVRHKEIIQRATVGFSYKFESPMMAPVVARY